MIGTNDRLCWVAESCNILILLLHLQNTAQSRQCAKKSANTNVETMKVKFHLKSSSEHSADLQHLVCNNVCTVSLDNT